MTEASAGTVLRAAGGVVWRSGEGGTPEVLVVHRPKYDDWSFPKGKRDPGETDEECALREVEEETGYVCALGPELRGASYVDRKRRPKEVRYWAMTVLTGEPRTGDEVDEVRWLPVSEACRLLTYPHDCEILESLLSGTS